MEFFYYPVFLIIIYTLQTAWLGFGGAGGATPDLVLVFAFYCGFRFDGNRGVAAAGLAGFAQDCLSGGLLGVNTLSKSLIGFLVSSIRKNIQVESFFPIAFFSACASFIDGMIFYLVSTLFLDRAVNQSVFFNALPVFALYNALTGPLMFYLLDRFQKRTGKRSLGGFSELS